MRRVDLNLLTIFEVMMAEQNTTRAAEKLHMSQSAVSDALGRLRDLYNDKLFLRTSQGMVPTQKSKQIFTHIRQALDLVETSLKEETEFSYGKSNRCFRIGMTDYAELVILPRLIDWLKNTAPHISLETFRIGVSYGKRSESIQDICNSLKSATLDLVLHHDPKLFKGCNSTQILEDSITLISSKDNQAVHAKLTMEQFRSLSHMVVKNKPENQELHKQGFQAKSIVQVPDYLAIPNVVAYTSIVAVVPERAARIFATNNELKFTDIPVELPPSPLYQIWHKDLDEDLGMTWLRKLIFSLCERL